MRNDFEIVAGFLDQTEPEVEGRAVLELPPQIRMKLQRFAKGELPPAEQAELVHKLNQDRQWIKFLAQEVKARRLGTPFDNIDR